MVAKDLDGKSTMNESHAASQHLSNVFHARGERRAFDAQSGSLSMNGRLLVSELLVAVGAGPED
jgi:hypothetical protein